MAFDPKRNIITVGEGQDFLADSGQFFLLTLKKMSEDTNLSEKGRKHSRKEWRIIEEWLGCKDRQLNDNDITHHYYGHFHRSDTITMNGTKHRLLGIGELFEERD